MQTDWKLLATAHGFNLTEAEREQLTAVLQNLEAVFGPIEASLAHHTEPAVILSEQAVAGI